MNKNVEFTIDKLMELTSIDSPSGFTDEVVKYTAKEFEEIGRAHV